MRPLGRRSPSIVWLLAFTSACASDEVCFGRDLPLEQFPVWRCSAFGSAAGNILLGCVALGVMGIVFSLAARRLYFLVLTALALLVTATIVLTVRVHRATTTCR